MKNSMMAVLRTGLVMITLLLLANCASEAPTTATNTTPGLPRALPMIAVASTQLPDYWQLPEEPEIQVPVTGGRNMQFGCVAVNFGIDAEGRTFDIQVRKSYPQGRFAEQAVARVKAWQFEPATANPIHQPVRTDRLLTMQSVDGDTRLVDAEHVAKFCR